MAEAATPTGVPICVRTQRVPSLVPAAVVDRQGAGHRVQIARPQRSAEQRLVDGRHDPDDVHEAIGHEQRARRPDGQAARVVQLGRGPVGRQPVGEVRPVAPRAAHDHADVARTDGRAVEGSAPPDGASSTDWSPLSATRRSPAASSVTATGIPQLCRVQRPALPVLPHTPVPATVKRPPARTACPKRVVVTAGTTRTRQLAVSAMKRSPAASTATPVGSSSSLAVASARRR